MTKDVQLPGQLVYEYRLQITQTVAYGASAMVCFQGRRLHLKGPDSTCTWKGQSRARG